MSELAACFHHHRDDYPSTLQLLENLLNARAWATVGYEITEHGAWIDWDLLLDSWLSSTEKAVVHIARGVAVLEQQGGPAPRLREPLRHSIAAVTT